MTRMLVIGAGVIGAATAFRLAQHGASVTLLDSGRPAGATSTSSFAWLNAHNKQPHAYYALNLAGMRAHAALAEELGDGSWRHTGGCLEWSDPPGRAAQRARAGRLRDWGYAVEWLTAAEARALEPDLDPSALGDAPVAYFPEEAWMEPARYVGALLTRFTALGGTIRTGITVAGLTLQGGRCVGLRSAAGEELAADMVVNCTGAAINSVTPEPGLHIPMASTPGLLVVTAPAATTLRRLIQAPGGIALRPDGGGRVMIHSKDADEAPGAPTATSLTHPAVETMLAAAARVLGPLAGVPADAMRLATRPITEDGHPAVGPIAGLSGYYVAVTHSGITLATLLAGAIAGEILEGREAPELAPFRPDRFTRSERPRRRMDGLR